MVFPMEMDFELEMDFLMDSCFEFILFILFFFDYCFKLKQ